MADYSRIQAGFHAGLKVSPLFESCQDLAWENPGMDRADGRYLIARLSPLRDMAASSGHLFLYGMLRSALGPRAFIDICFFPSAPDRKEMDAAGMPWLTGIRGNGGPGDYSAILFSCSYAPEMLNVPAMLLKSGIPPRASMRQEPRPDGGRWPLIILGGSNALASQALIFPDGDSFVDGIFFGEGEDGGGNLARIIAGTGGLAPRARALEIAGSVHSFWPAGGSMTAPVRVARCLENACDPSERIRPPVLNTPDASTTRIRISRGCPSTCTFCFEGWEHKPWREIPVDAVLENARHRAIGTGASTVELESFNFNAHTGFAEILAGLHGIFDRVNMMSQRADLLAFTPGMLELEIAGEKTGYAIGVEGISAGMRAFYSKGLSSSALDGVVARLVKAGVREIKLFYILAGIEDDEDFREFEAFCSRLAGLRSGTDRGPRVLFSFGYLVRMPFTPLRRAAPCLDRKHLETLAARAGRIVERAGFEFRVATDWDEYAADQMLVLGPHDLAGVLENAARAGAVFDLGVDPGFRRQLEDSLRGCGMIGPDGRSGPFVMEKPAGWPWPLGFLETAVDGRYIDERFESARRRVDGGGCMAGLESAGADPACLGCGACPTAAGRAALTGHSIARPTPAQVRELAALVRAKRRMRPRFVLATLPASISGATPEFLNAWLLRSVLSRFPELTGRLFRVVEALWSSPELRERFVTGMTGGCVLALYGLDDVVGDEPPRLADDSFARAVDALSLELGCPVVETAPPFEPAAISVRVTPPAGADDQDILQRVRRYLGDLRLNAVERKADGGRLFEIAPKDLKKRVLSSVRVTFDKTGGRAASVLLEGGSRLDVAAFFRGPAERAGVVVEVTRLVPARTGE